MTHPGIKATVTLSVALALPVSAWPPASAASMGDDPTFEIATVNGSGCPPGSVSAVTGTGGFTIKYRAFTARIGGDAKPTDFRKNCQINLKATVPKGVTYAVMGSDHRGSADLGPGTTGHLKSAFYFAGTPQLSTFTGEIRGPVADGWQLSQKVPPSHLQWVRCDDPSSINLNTEIRLASSDKTKPGVLDVNAELGTSYHLAWKTCP
ncbi:DUF4360 domain-containing protein [Actinomadura sp. 9N215]|uniref:DUF4360 domain-containing protein n=1 Tax=Actinomadura sp. 9N215 TaxID=3375150 RepID=UPI0037AA1EA4